MLYKVIKNKCLEFAWRAELAASACVNDNAQRVQYLEKDNILIIMSFFVYLIHFCSD